MRILHVVHQYPPHAVGGTELVTQALARGMVAQGHAVAVFTRVPDDGQGCTRSDEDGVVVYRAWDGVPSAGARYLASFTRGALLASFVRALEEFKPDLVHIQHLMGLPLAAPAQLRTRGLPTVITLHDYWWFCANAQLLTNYDATLCGGPRGHINCTRCALARGGSGLIPVAPLLWASLRVRDRLLRRGLAAADLVIAPSRFVADLHMARGLDAARVRVRPWGVESLPAARAYAPQRPLRLATVGGLAWQKGVHIAVDAATRCGDAVTLAVAGSGDDLAYVDDLRRRAGKNVTFLGRLDRNGVACLLAESDALLLPSLWYETYSLILHEAWAAGVPVIASDLGVLAATVRHGVDGLLVAPGDVAAWHAVLARLAAAPEELVRLARAIQPPPTLSQCVAALLQDYAQLLRARVTAPVV